MTKIVKLSVISSALFLNQFAFAGSHITVDPASTGATEVVHTGDKTTVNISPANSGGVSYNAISNLTSGKRALYLIIKIPQPI